MLSRLSKSLRVDADGCKGVTDITSTQDSCCLLRHFPCRFVSRPQTSSSSAPRGETHSSLLVLLLYDILLNSGREYQYVWRAPKPWVSRILYVLNRYMSLLALLLGLGTIPSVSDTVSTQVLSITRINLIALYVCRGTYACACAFILCTL